MPARHNNTQPSAASSRMSTVTNGDDFLPALVVERLYEELAAADLLWHVGYLGGFENKLRKSQTYWSVPLMEDASGGASRSSSRFRNTSWTGPEQTLGIACAREVCCASPSNSGPPLSRCICLSRNSGYWTHRQP
jgi:hypothetical protein